MLRIHRLYACSCLFVVSLACNDSQPSAVPEPSRAEREVGARHAALTLTQPTVVTLTATADTHVAQSTPTFNFGTATALKVTGVTLSNWEASLVKFDASAIQAAVGTGTLQSASLQLTLDSASLGWGDSQVSISRMTAPWTENGATWLCANDTNNTLTGKFLNDCSSQNLWGLEWWSLLPRPYLGTPTAVVSLPFALQGVVSANVTADVQAALSGTPHQGWLLTATSSLASVWVRFVSRQGSAAPHLVLTIVPAVTCTPAGSDNNCNQLDDDCDGRTDEAFASTSTSCGTGACARTGTTGCVNGTVTNNCAPGMPAASDASCDGVDNNCNGQIDETYVGTATSCGTGACANTGTSVCAGGMVLSGCSPRQPLASSDATCDGIDDDCSGQADEDYVAMTISCGSGACANTGTSVCGSGSESASCSPRPPLSMHDTTCDGVDDNCNGQPDEGFVAATTSCNKGGCLAHGQSACSNGQLSDTCASGGVCYAEANCSDMGDNDGDGRKDCADSDCGLDSACASSVPDPRLVAPTTDRSHYVSTYELTQFLFTGSNPIQSGVSAGAIKPERIGIVRGQVIDREGVPLRDVNVSVVNHPELGSTLTRADGAYDLALNGGPQNQLQFKLAGYQVSQRLAQVNWEAFLSLDDVVLTPTDPTVSTVSLGAGSAQIVRGSSQTDTDGTRQATMLFPPSVTAQMVLPNNTTQSLSSMHVRVTEYSVGPNGPSAVPAQLPPRARYAYAAAFDVDEATALNAKSTQFNVAVPVYLENFLGWRTGLNIPARSYDNAAGVWTSSADGRVIKLLSITGGAADLDTNGDGAPDDAATLSGLGVTAAERSQLASLYTPGSTLWRVPVKHFSPWELDEPLDPEHPNQPQPGEQVNGGYPSGTSSNSDSSDASYDWPIDNACQSEGSTIRVENGSMTEEIPIAGSPFKLNYSSARTQAAVSRGLELKIPIEAGIDIPHLTFRGTSARVDIGGQVLKEFVPQSSGATEVTLTWDGLNAYKKEMIGATRATIRTCRIYETGVQRRPQIELCASHVVQVTPYLSTAFGPDGWMLSAQQVFDTTGRVVTQGNGQQISAKGRPLGYVATDVISHSDGSPDLGPANPTGFVQLSDGSMIIMRSTESSPTPRPIRFTSNHTYPGNATGFFADLSSYWSSQQWLTPVTLLPGPNGTVYARERASLPQNMVRDEVRRYILDASQRFIQPGQVVAKNVNPLAAGTDGTLYAFGAPGQVLQVTPDGQSSTLYQSPRIDANSRNTVAIKGRAPGSLTASDWLLSVGVDGTVFLLEQWAASGVRPLVGGLYALPAIGGETQLLTNAQYEAGAPDIDPNDGVGATAMTVDPTTGHVFVAAGMSARISEVVPGQLRSVVGENFDDLEVDVGPKALWMTKNMAFGPDGLLYFSEIYGGAWVSKIRRVEPSFPGEELFPSGSYQLPAPDAQTVYYFDAGGRQTEARVAGSGDLIYSFGYTAGWLTGITDRYGNQTRIVRDGTGNPTSIVAPFGQTTLLGLDSNGQIQTVTAPDSTRYDLTYDGSMLSTLTNPRDYSSSFAFDSKGRLNSDDDAAGGGKILARDAAGTTTQLTTAAQVHTSYGTSRSDTGLTRVVTMPDGTSNTSVEASTGETTLTRADGTVETSQRSADPIWGMVAPFTGMSNVTYPSTRSSQTSVTRTATPVSFNQPFGPADRTQTTVINGRSYTQSYQASTRTLTSTTPEGRVSTTSQDAAGLHVQSTAPGRAAQTTTLDSRGRPISIVWNDGSAQRTRTFAYDSSSGYRSATTGPIAGQTTSYVSDGFGRVISEQRPDGVVIGYGLDENGNQSSETPPGQPAHVLSYTPVDLVASYRAPHPSMAGSALQLTTYTYTLDRDIKRIAFADGQDITYQYGSDGKLSHRVTSRSDELYVYDTSTGKLNGITGSDGRVLAFAYDGDVTTGMTWSGGNNQTSGAVTLSYDANSWIAGLAVNGANVSSFTYDDDGLALTAGALQISRDPASGDVIGTQLGSQLTTDEAINRFGESTSYVSRFNGTALYSEQVTQRDLLGRISDRTEVVSGTTHTYHYVYDAAGRLTDASLDGGSNVHYSYDDNGNRLSRTGPSGTETGAYDLQDRLKTFGARQYTFSEVGALLTMTDSAASATTHYDYDALGNLRSVSLPDGRHVEYEIDAQDRRIGKRVDGARVYGLLYKDGLVPVVQLGASNAVVATFVYGTRTNVPDYMVKGGETYRFVVDHLNSVRMLVRVSDGGVAQRIDYDEFGVATNDTNPGFQPFGFAGGLYDGDTKLVRFGARDYDAVTGRWTAKDPILFGAGQANLYAYVGNEPINRRDTTGLWTLQLGGQVNFGVTGGGTLGVSLGFDDNGNVALLFTAGYGWENGATASGFVAATNADTLNDITGWGKAAGGGVGPVGVEKLWGDGYEGGSLSFGVGTPVEVHAEFDERTWKLDLCTAN